MWYEYVDRLDFLKKLYTEIPPLDGIRLVKLSVLPIENRIEVSFVLLQLPDWIPAKWKSMKGNAIKIELYFFCVNYSEIKMDRYVENGNIEISKDEEGCLRIYITGPVNALVIAEAATVDNVKLTII